MANNPFEAPQYEPERAFPRADASRAANLKWWLFSLEGRIGRAEYIVGTLITVGATLAIGLFLALILGINQNSMSIFALLMAGPYIATIWSSFALQAKRWHDRDKSALWIFFGLVPIIGGIWVFIETYCLPGTPGPNRFGAPRV